MPVLSADVDTTLPSSDGVYRHGFDAFPSWDLRSWLGAVNLLSDIPLQAGRLHDKLSLISDLDVLTA